MAIAATAIPSSARARAVAIETQFKDLRQGNVQYLPQRVAVFAQGSDSVTYSTDKQQVTSATQAGQLYGFGSPAHLSVLQLLPPNGDGVGTIPVTVYPLDAAAGATAAAGDITPSGTQTRVAEYRVKIGGIISNTFVISPGDTVADIIGAMVTAISAIVEMPVIASDGTTKLDLTAKWSGATGDQIKVSVLGAADAGTTFAITQPTGGAGTPDVDTALAKVGTTWETMILNTFNISDKVTLDKFQTYGEGRWQPLKNNPPMVFTGNTEVDPTAAVSVSDARKLDRINGQLVAPGSDDMPFVVAARELARIAFIANAVPPWDYGLVPVDGIDPGADSDQWEYPERDAALKKGSSSIEVIDGLVHLSDTVTFYHPEGDPVAAYRYVVDIVKIQNILYNVNLTFNTREWAGAPLVPDSDPVGLPQARSPKQAKAAMATLIDSFRDNAWISDAEFAKASIRAEIDSQNAKRLNLCFTAKLSGNVNIVAIEFNFGFYYGNLPIIA